MDILWEHGRPYAPDLGEQIRGRAGTGQAIVWVSASGTILLFAAGGLCGMIRTRVHRGRTQHPGDGLALEAPGLEASSCGCWDATGYASTPPLVVAAIDTAGDVQVAYDRAREHGSAWLPIAPAGHPPAHCGAHICLHAPDAVSPRGP